MKRNTTKTMKRNTTKTKLVATIVSMVSALCLLAVGVFATLTNFQVAIANQLNLKFDAVEGTLYATRLGDVAGTDRTTSKVLSESTTTTDWLKVYDGTTAEGVQDDAIASIQEKVDFISNDKIKEKVNAGTTSIAITYYFYYTLPADAVANNITLTAPAVADTNVAITYSYVKATSANLPAFTDATTITDGAVVTVSGGEHLFIKAEAKVDLSKSVKIENADWQFTLNFGISQYSLNGDTLTFNAVTGAETYEVWAKQTSTSGTSLLAQTSSVGDTDSTLGTLVKILDKTATSVDLVDALSGQATGEYIVAILPKKASGIEIVNNRTTVSYSYTARLQVYVTDEAIEGNYYYYIELGEYPQTVVEDTTIIAALNALGDNAKTGRTFTVGASEDVSQTAHVEYLYNGNKYVKVAKAAVFTYQTYPKFASGTVPTGGNTYWFKVEPIKWFLLEAYSTTKTAYAGPSSGIRVISEQILTSNVRFGYTTSSSYTLNLADNPLLSMSEPTVYGTEWEKTNVRAWLNNAFYTTAFSVDDQAYIATNTTRYFGAGGYNAKDDYTSTTGGSTTEDNVWLLSFYEIKNTYYTDNLYLNKKSRAATPTDFAVVNYVYMGSNGGGWYWLRSAGTDGTACSVNYSGILYSSDEAGSSYLGVRPALTISL